jgi:hypothetical protein
MFEQLREAFRQAVENFRHEVSLPIGVSDEPRGREDPAGSGASPTGTPGDLRAKLSVLRGELRRLHAEFDLEESEAARCDRQARLAAAIEDFETVRIAESHASRHRLRGAFLQARSEAIVAEMSLLEAEYRALTRRLWP